MEKTILVDHLVKNFEVTEKTPGLMGAFSTLFSPKKKVIHALKDISLSVGKGELVGFIGPNGAGKTTTLKILSGLLFPTAGVTQVLGFDPWERRTDFLKKISLVMGQKNQLWWDLPAIDTFELNRAIYEIPTRVYKESLDELVTLLDIGKLLNIQVRRLSLGQRMRMELLAALLHKPKVLFLDEPTIGLDVLMQQTVRNFIKDYNKEQGGAIILTSHYMEDVKELCKRVIIVSEGSVVYDGLLSEIITKFSKHKIIEVILKTGEIQTQKVIRSRVAATAAKVLENTNVADINIKEVGIEEVIRSVFSLNKK